MSVGTFVDKASIDSRAGNTALAVFQAMEGAKLFKQWLDSVTDNTLEAAPYSYTAGEVAILRSAMSDLDQLRTIFEGSANLANAKDFRAFAKLIAGFGY